MPKITLITPTYNRAHLLPETIDNILSQDFADFEYLIIDDGSQDDTKEVVKPYLKDPRVQYFYHDNKGEAGTVNRGWHMAKGELVAIINSDDPVKADFLNTIVHFMDQNLDVIVGYPDWDMIDENGKTLRTIQVQEQPMIEMIVSHHCDPGPGAVIRKSALQEVQDLRDTRFTYISDLATWWKLAFYGKFARIPHNIATWRYHKGSISSSSTIKIDKIVREHKLLTKEFFKNKNVPINILKRKKEAFRQTNWIILNTIKAYSKQNHSLKARWNAFKNLMESPVLAKKYFKVLAKVIFR